MMIKHLPKPSAARAAELLSVAVGDLTHAEFAEIEDVLNRTPRLDPKKSVAALLAGTVFDPTRLKKGGGHRG